ncbi:hypothetical protein INT45_011399 [Circinella minor]|uniref:Uncharacterized protein n=1 Tax=Circinella minor TaxID=1195481 RepID=A0A8H7SAQ1_9FUNG|nr:hypothetical protein INT45_011399 [Circinella minor]
MHINIKGEDKHRFTRKQKAFNRLWRHRIIIFLVTLLGLTSIIYYRRKVHYTNILAQQQLQQLVLNNYSYGEYNTNRHVIYDTPIKGALVVMAREGELFEVHATMTDVEDRFNQHHGYPWIILSDQLLSKRFQKIITAKRKNVYFGKIPPDHWNEPAWIDIKEAEKIAVTMGSQNIYHGESISWKKATRYNAGLIALHPLLQDAEYYWKVQPRARYICDIREDPFQSMKENDQKLAFAISMKESHLVIPSLWNSVQEYVKNEMKNLSSLSSLVPPTDSIFPWIIDEPSSTDLFPTAIDQKYNNNQIWNNFMIISLNFMRSPEYQRFFRHMDIAGGFFYERWGDSPFQTIAAALYLHKHQVHFMENIGYQFSIAMQCPSDEIQVKELKCACDSTQSFCKYK